MTTIKSAILDGATLYHRNKDKLEPVKQLLANRKAKVGKVVLTSKGEVKLRARIMAIFKPHEFARGAALRQGLRNYLTQATAVRTFTRPAAATAASTAATPGQRPPLPIPRSSDDALRASSQTWTGDNGYTEMRGDHFEQDYASISPCQEEPVYDEVKYEVTLTGRSNAAEAAPLEKPRLKSALRQAETPSSGKRARFAHELATFRLDNGQDEDHTYQNVNFKPLKTPPPKPPRHTAVAEPRTMEAGHENVGGELVPTPAPRLGKPVGQPVSGNPEPASRTAIPRTIGTATKPAIAPKPVFPAKQTGNAATERTHVKQMVALFETGTVKK